MTTMKVACSIIILGLAAGIMAGSGCWTYADSHCGNLAGAVTCAERGGESFCNVCVAFNDGCTNELPSEECQFVDVGSGASGMEENGTTGMTNGDNTIGVTIGGVMSLDGGASAEETTLEATDGGHATTADEPSCDGKCDGFAPICDVASGTCVPCKEHAECGEAACNFFTGACLSARVVHVGPNQSYARLEDAVSSFTAETSLEGTIIVHSKRDDYEDDVVIEQGRTIAFLSFGSDLPVWNNDQANTSPLVVSGMGATAILQGVVLTARNLRPGLRVNNSGQVWVDRARIIENGGGGVVVEQDAEAVLRNCFIGGNEWRGNAVSVVQGRARVLYSTLMGVGNFQGLRCDDATSVVVRNSIIVTFDNPNVNGDTMGIDCSGTVVDITSTATDSIFPGTGNVSVGQMLYDNPDAWFVDYANEDFHLENDGPDVFADIAQWQPGDPLVDIDGDPRPNIEGSSDHAGADRP